MIDAQRLAALIAILPQLLVVGLAVVLGLVFHEPLGRVVDQRLTGVSAFGFRLDLRPSDVDSAVQQRLGDAAPGNVSPVVPRAAVEGAGKRVVERAEKLSQRLAGRTMLWVDDHPDGNRLERQMLRQMGIFCEAVISNSQAVKVLDAPTGSIDVIVTDISRDSGLPNGIALLTALRTRPRRPPVIVYVASLHLERGVPPDAFGITDRPDELLHLIMDALER